MLRVPGPALIWVIVVVFLVFSRTLHADEPAGAAVYRQWCARCHGKSGEGTREHHPEPLVGDRTVAQLARYISKSMPKDAPGKIPLADANRVAAYIHDAFYSPAAQANRRPPRLELARLTVNEYRNAVSDLVGSFRPTPVIKGGAHGLRGDYFTTTAKRQRTPIFSRIDSQISFDFGVGSLDLEKIKTGDFSATWQGSIVPPDTGSYEFFVRTEHAARLWVNDPKRPLIDASIKSGNETEFRGSTFLLAGRVYPLKLEFVRGNIGVRKEAKEKAAPPKTTITLAWKSPLGGIEVVPSRRLIPSDSPVTFAPATPFPADDRSVGYERGTTVSKAWVQAITEGAIDTASHVTSHLAELSGVPAEAADRKVRLRKFCVTFAERAFRRPLSPDQERLYIDHHFEAAADPEAAVKRVVLLVLQSPRFLYREPGTGRTDAFDVAARMSFALWDSLPDAQLVEAAASGRLVTRADVVREAERMLDDRRTWTKVRAFLWQWLKVDQVADLTKDAKRFPQFDAAVVADLRSSLDLFLEEAIWAGTSDFRSLFLADHLYLNDRLTAIYGGSAPVQENFRKVVPRPGERAGVLTHPYLMAAFAYSSTSSPIHRGVFVARDLLGVSLRPPPDAFAPFSPDLHPNLTTRERIALQTGPRSCRTCHNVINPLGFPLEHFDAIGRYRDRENGKPIDASGSYLTRSGDVVEFKTVADLARFLASSEEAHDAFVTRAFHYLIKQPIRAFGPAKQVELRRFFADHGYDFRKLIVEIVAQTAVADRSGDRRDIDPPAR